MIFNREWTRINANEGTNRQAHLFVTTTTELFLPRITLMSTDNCHYPWLKFYISVHSRLFAVKNAQLRITNY